MSVTTVMSTPTASIASATLIMVTLTAMGTVTTIMAMGSITSYPTSFMARCAL
jgi:hypothetical protein